CAFTRVLAPDAVLELERAHRLLGRPAPSLCSLSRDPAATREELVKAIAIFSTFWCSFTLARRGYRPVIHHAVAMSAVLLAAVGAVHTQFGARRVFGLYAPVDTHFSTVLSPILAVNTYGGLLAMCAPLLMALALVERDRLRKSLFMLSNGLVF